MRRRARQQSSSNPRKKVKFVKDWLSELSDDILVNIISRLTLKEAGRTSVLSSRWKDLWILITNLHFDAPKSVLKGTLKVADRDRQKNKYINWVNKVLECHRGWVVDEFRIHFDLDESHENHITKWIYLALSNDVRKFELSLPQIWSPKRAPERYIIQPECCNYIRRLCGGPRTTVRSLKSLCFSDVHVNGEILELFLDYYPLEQLHVAGSAVLSSLKVIGASVQLKDLQIDACTNLQEVEVSAPSLLSLKILGFHASKIKFRVENLPRIADIAIGGYCDRPMHDIAPIINYFPQLTTLYMDFALDQVYKSLAQCELPNLRHFTFNVFPCTRSSILHLTDIMKACPFLEGVTLRTCYYLGLNDSGISRRLEPKCPLQHLKVVEMYEFVGFPTELIFAAYFMVSGNMPEKVIVRPSRIMSKENSRIGNYPKLLEQILPPGVQLVKL